MDSRIHLGVVSYEVDILRDFGDSIKGDCFIEYNFNQVEKNGFRAIIYDSQGESAYDADSVAFGIVALIFNGIITGI